MVLKVRVCMHLKSANAIGLFVYAALTVAHIFAKILFIHHTRMGLWLDQMLSIKIVPDDD